MAQAVKKEVSTKSSNLVVANSLSDLVSTPETQELIVKTLGKSRLQTFMGNVLTIAQDPKFADVEPSSVFNCLLKTAVYSFPLDPNIGYSYIVPYKNKDGVKVGQFQLGAKGFTELAYRTNKYTRLNVSDVREGEYKGKDWFGEPQIEWSQSPDRNSKKIVGYVAAFELTNGMRKREFWDTEKIKEHANKYSKAHQYALKSKDLSEDRWSTDADSMSRKTVLKALISKYGPKSTELQDAIKFDQSVIERKNGVETPLYVDSTIVSEDVDTNKVYDIDIETGEIVDNTTQNKASTQTINAQVEDEEGVEYIDYEIYKNNKDKYERAPKDGENPFNKETGKIRVRKKD